MFGIHDLGLFVLTGFLLNLTPGPDSLYILGRSIAQGRNAGFASALGIAAGSLVHTLAAACGLSALLAASAAAFMLVKLAGGAYLIYLGVKMLLAKSSSDSIPTAFPSNQTFSIFRQGMITNVLNPKVALFFLALMPQFISADSHAKFAAFLTLGLCFITTGTIWCCCLVLFASFLGDKLRGSESFAQVVNKAAGALFVGLGLRLAVSK